MSPSEPTCAKPFINWVGGKSLLAKKIISLFPEHGVYCELFGGSAAVLLAKKPSAVEVYNDKNKELVALFRVVKSGNGHKRLFELLEITPYSRAEFQDAKSTEEDNDVERARKFVIRCVQSYAGIGGHWAFPKSAPKNARGEFKFKNSCMWRWRRAIDRIHSAHARLKSVAIECDDWKTVAVRYDTKETLFYLDPPYLQGTRKKNLYDEEMTNEEHARLLDVVLELRGMVVLSGYKNQLYNDTLEKHGWRLVELKTIQKINNSRSARIECLWLSPAVSKKQRHVFVAHDCFSRRQLNLCLGEANAAAWIEARESLQKFDTTKSSTVEREQ